MTTFETKVYKETDGNVVGVEVIAYDSNDKVIDTLKIVNEADLNNLEARLSDLEGSAVVKSVLTTILTNTDKTTTINATKLDGLASGEFSRTGHTHSYAPVSHRSTTNTYGVGDKDYYGHVKVDSSLSSNSTNPIQNKVVKAGLDDKSDNEHTHNDTDGVVSVDCSYGTVKCFKKNGWATVYWENVNLTGLTVDTWTTIATLPYSNQTGANYYGNFQTGATTDRFRITEQGELKALTRGEGINHIGHYGYITYPTND